MPLSQEEINELVKGLVKANKESLKEFYVDREVHYQHHEFLGRLIKSLDAASSLIGRTVLVAFIIGVMGLIALGFWTKIGN